MRSDKGGEFTSDIFNSYCEEDGIQRQTSTPKTPQRNGIFISQTKYLKGRLKKFGMEDCKPVGTPMVTGHKLTNNDETKSIFQTKYKSVVCGLQYLTHTRPDIANVVGIMTRY